VYYSIVFSTPPPLINTNGVVNAANYSTSIAGGDIAAVFGSDFADCTTANTFVMGPNGLSDGQYEGSGCGSITPQTHVLVNGVPAPMTYVSATQINFQVPRNISTTLQAVVEIQRGSLKSNRGFINITRTDPTPFPFNNMAILTDTSGKLVTADNPPQAGKIYTLWLQGLGATANDPQTGMLFGSSPLPYANAATSLSICGSKAQIQYAGGGPNELIDQINFYMPSCNQASAASSGVLTVGTQTVTLSIPQ
jgi:uncharacterized protein (TIGR03437 family)